MKIGFSKSKNSPRKKKTSVPVLHKAESDHLLNGLSVRGMGRTAGSMWQNRINIRGEITFKVNFSKSILT